MDLVSCAKGNHKINCLKMKVVPHPPYSPDLAPCDFWLFSELEALLFKEPLCQFLWNPGKFLSKTFWRNMPAEIAKKIEISCLQFNNWVILLNKLGWPYALFLWRKASPSSCILRSLYVYSLYLLKLKFWIWQHFEKVNFCILCFDACSKKVRSKVKSQNSILTIKALGPNNQKCGHNLKISSMMCYMIKAWVTSCHCVTQWQ